MGLLSITCAVVPFGMCVLVYNNRSMDMVKSHRARNDLLKFYSFLLLKWKQKTKREHYFWGGGSCRSRQNLERRRCSKMAPLWDTCVATLSGLSTEMNKLERKPWVLNSCQCLLESIGKFRNSSCMWSKHPPSQKKKPIYIGQPCIASDST